MPELALDGGDIAGALHDPLAHGVAGGVRGFAGHSGGAGDRVPDVIETADAEPATIAAVSRRGEKQRR